MTEKERTTERYSLLADDLQSALNAVLEDSPTTRVPAYLRRLAASTMERIEGDYYGCKLSRPTYERLRDICRCVLEAARLRGVSKEWRGAPGEWRWMKYARDNSGHMESVFAKLPFDD